MPFKIENNIPDALNMKTTARTSDDNYLKLQYSDINETLREENR
jgi:hypothetical protein